MPVPIVPMPVPVPASNNSSNRNEYPPIYQRVRRENLDLTRAVPDRTRTDDIMPLFTSQLVESNRLPGIHRIIAPGENFRPCYLCFPEVVIRASGSCRRFIQFELSWTWLSFFVVKIELSVRVVMIQLYSYHFKKSTSHWRRRGERPPSLPRN